MRPPPRTRPRHGFTLVELVISVSISSILLLGISSSIYLAARASDLTIGPFADANAGSTALFQLNRELKYVIALNDLVSSATAVEFTLSDISGDAANDVIRYQWSGVAGAPLLRIQNGGTPQTVVSDVRAFSLTYQTKTVGSGGSAIYYNLAVASRIQVGTSTAATVHSGARTRNEPQRAAP